MEPSTCPWCGLNKKVYVRAGSELVCIDCVKMDAAMDALIDIPVKPVSATKGPQVVFARLGETAEFETEEDEKAYLKRRADGD